MIGAEKTDLHNDISRERMLLSPFFRPQILTIGKMSIASTALFDVVKRKGLSLSPLHKKGKANNDVFSAELRKKERGNRP